MTAPDLPTGAAAIAAAVRSGRLRALDVLERHLALIDTRNPELNAIVALRADGARRDAVRVDRMIEEGADPGPLAGVPFTVKDILATAELPTTCGSRALAGHRTPRDADAVALLRAAGAILTGKTNTPEFAFGIHTVNELHGTTTNPLGPTSVGGSSGGEAAAVASGMSAFGVGTDFGGSLRWPSQCTATVGMRSEVGTVPAAGTLPAPDGDAPSLQDLVQVVGPITGSVEDARLVTAVLTGDRLGASGGDSRVLAGTSVGPVAVDDEIAAAVDRAATILSRTGAEVGALPSLLARAGEVFDELRAGEGHHSLLALVGDRLGRVEERNRRLLELRSAGPEARAWQERDALVAELDALMAGDTVLLLPVSTRPAEAPSAATVQDFDVLRPCRAISLFGLPAVAVPCGSSAGGRPVSVQLVGPRGGTRRVLEVAAVIERAARGGETT